MAENSREELNNKKEQLKVEERISNVISSREQAYRRSVEISGDALDISRQITEDIKDQMGMIRAKSEADTGALSLARKLQQSVQMVTTELGNQGKINRQILNDQNLLSSIRTEIANIDKKIGQDGVEAAGKIAEILFDQQDLQKQIEEKKQEISILDDESKKIEQDKLKSLEDQLATKERELKTQEDLIGNADRNDVRRLVQLKQQEDIGETLIKQRKAELDIQREIEDHTGVTGALVEGVGGIMQRLGMRSGIFQNAMALAAEDMKDMSEETIRTEKAIEQAQKALKALPKNATEAEKATARNNLKIAQQGKQYDKVQIALAGATQLAKGFGKALFDPLTIALAIFDGFLKVDKAATDLQQITGQNSTTLIGFNTRLASSVDMMETMAELTRQTGMNAQNIFSPEVIAGAAELKNTMGLAADEAGGLAMIAQTTSGDIDAVTDSIVDTTSAFNAANRSAVSQGQILRDVAKASDGIKASLSGNPKAIAQAASAARRLGMELSQVDSIASSLMDFESSIEAELEAQLLTGKNINMAKARELALNNDLAGLGKELFKNSSDLAEFGKMNRIQQEAQAKALGMSRDELAKIAYQRAIEAGMTEAQAEAAAGVRAEDMKRMAVQERLQKAAEKLAQAFAPMLEIVASIAEGISFILTPIAGLVSGAMKLASVFGKVGQLIMGATILGGVGLLRKSLIQAFNPKIAGNFFTHLKSNFKGIGKTVSGFKDKLKEAFTGKAGKITEDIKTKAKDKLKDSVTDKVNDKTSTLTDKSKKRKKGGGMDLAKSIEKIDAKKLLAGAGAMLIAATAVFVFAKAAQEFGKVDPGAILAAVGSMFALVGAVALLSTFVSGPQALALLAGAAAMLIVASALFVLGKAVQEIGKGMKTLGEGISGELIENLFKLGPALLSAAKGIALFGAAMAIGGLGAFLGGGMITQLQELANLATPLSTVGASLTAIAAGIAALSAALNTLEIDKLEEVKDLVMTTAFAAPMVAATGAITSMLQGITGGGESDSSNAELIEEIKLLRAAVERGGTINMDGNKVGQYIMLSANKSA